MDLITYALLKKQGGSSADINEIKNRLNLLEQEIDEKIAVLDAGLTPVASKKGEVIVNEVTDEVWDRLNNDNADVYAAVDGVVIRATYAVNQDNEVEISEGSRVICTISEDDDEYSIDWNEYYNDADISLTAVGVIGEALHNIIDASNGGIIEGDIEDSKADGYLAHAEGISTTASGYYSHAEGANTIASGIQTHAEGKSTTSSGTASHAEGSNTQSTGLGTHSEGQGTIAEGATAHAEGSWTHATGQSSHSEGAGTVASGMMAHAEGSGSVASGYQSHAEGLNTVANGSNMYAGGMYNTEATLVPEWVASSSYNIGDLVSRNGITYSCISATSSETWVSAAWKKVRESNGNTAFVIGNGIDANNRSNAMHLDWSGNLEVAGKITVGSAPVNNMDVATKQYVDSHSGDSSLQNIVDAANGGIIEGLTEDNLPSDLRGQNKSNQAIGNFAHAEGGWTYYEYGDVAEHTTASGTASHAEGGNTVASGKFSHAEGYTTTASGDYSHTEGMGTEASEGYAHAEGTSTEASGEYSHAEGTSTTASNSGSHAEGGSTTASGNLSHAEGYGTTASGDYSHAEGHNATASEDGAHAEGYSTTASGKYSHASGSSTTANAANMFAIGSRNIPANITTPWASRTSYSVGDTVSYLGKTYSCKTANSDSSFKSSKWDMLYNSDGDVAFVIGNCVDSSNRSNAMKVDWNGNQYLMGDVYVGCDSSSASGMKVATVNEIGGYVVTISDANPVIDAAANTRYVCGEVATLSFTPPQYGNADVRFISGSTATVLTLPNTVKMPSWFTVEANKIYEINIMDGVYGVAMSWNV